MSYNGGVPLSAGGQQSLATSREFEIATVSAYIMIRSGSSKNWSIKHMTTNELVRPLTIPGDNAVGDEDSLYRDHFTTELIEGRKCTYCNHPAMGAANFQQDHVPWKRYAGQISRSDPSPVRWGPPYIDAFLREYEPKARGNSYSGSSLTDRIALSEKIKSVGFYKPAEHLIGIPTCGQMPCQRQAARDVKDWFREVGFGPELPLFLQPFTTAPGTPVCQVCGKEDIKLCKKDESYCGFGYCGREHQMLDWPNHKEACKYHRKRGNVPDSNKKPIVSHMFIGHPERRLKYYIAVNSVDVRMLDITNPYSVQEYPKWARTMDDTQNSSLEGDENGLLMCMICKKRVASTSGSFHSLPITADGTGSDMHKYYESMLKQYSKAGAFPGKSVGDTLALFNDLRSKMAQMAALYIPVCDNYSCLQKTPAVQETVIKKIMYNDGQILKPVPALTTVYR